MSKVSKITKVVPLKSEVLIKYLLSRENPITTKEIFSKYESEHSELRSVHNLKHNILTPLWRKGDLVKKVDKDVINPLTKKATWLWALRDDLKEVYEKETRETLKDFEYKPEDKIKKHNWVPLLGRTGSYSNFSKEGSFEDFKFQKQ